MSKFREGDRVRFSRGVFLYKGIIVQADAVLTVEQVHDHDNGVCSYDVKFLDREQQPHVIPGVKEADLKLAGGGPENPVPRIGRPPAFED